MAERNRPNSKTIVYRSERWKKDHSRSVKPIEQKTCRIKDVCGTCQFINGDYQNSLDIKYRAGLEKLTDKTLLQGTQVTSPIPSPRSQAYRTHAKLAVRPATKSVTPHAKDGRFAIGLFQPKSHKVVDISFCPLHRNSINRLIRDLKPALNDSSLTPYDEETHTGDLRYIAIRASHLTEEVMVTFICMNDSKRLELKSMILQLRNLGHTISAAHLNVNGEQTNTIFGGVSKRLAGSDRLREELCDLSFEIGPTSFFQVNPWQAENVYRRVEQIAGPDRSHSVAWDLYCGTGQISMLLANAGYRTIGIEENPQATRDAQKNVVRNRVENTPQFVAGRVEEITENFPSWAQEPRLIVVNPSRKGLSDSVREFLKSTMARSQSRLIYVSCDINTLVRDLDDLKSTGKRVVQLDAFDMFPFTDKMEWLAVLN
ncbi:23S rRNA (uracil(1939)-C(5))-methyltransferase RlmD [Pseudobacteriovorax antillogorgiicola]|uniref:23S rRNA m(5)U-1939 methyltransferase n=1 Tax=Pseudobacteriovorax antillogorgiicola TaxID=1513793 RepID=A0A1Y6C564_9BACT|nr:23S rRNA (uracil(1939)-C(5))-methyltransferase RlmD [Pseudobacteriovorax antillogorgiicola]TCS49461.1 23S rRNA m(5)U-1939 methyltransferase [Pseudobacteriovorax antillogorgiicola]SMF46364.1 23S rRNA m(5)U-1939 methyltransferase [Pseudobacteriovorax antillogorgiicola]